MASFEKFEKKNGPASKCRKATKKSLSTYEDKLPAELISHWKAAGWCAYADGLIWLANPADFKGILDDWLEKSDKSLAIMRTAFGNLFIWDDDGVHFLDVLHNKIFPLTDDLEILFDLNLCRDKFLEDVLDRKTFQEAKEKLGPLAHTECYGYEPAIALGGPGTVETLKKVKLREYLGILAELR